MELNRQGVSLSFEMYGEGEHTFLFIHGLGIDRSFFASEVHYFAQKGRVLSVDLRGHGQSGKPEGDYSIETYADDIQWLCKELHLKKIAIVGHSIGGNIGLELIDRNPEIYFALVLLDTFLFIPSTGLEYLSQKIKEMQGPEFVESLNQIVETRCLSMDIYKDKVKKSLFNTSPNTWSSSLESLVNWDRSRAEGCIERCQLPVLYIEGPTLILNISRFNELYSSNLVRGKVVGCGHYLSIEVPEQINAMIDRFFYLINRNKK